MLAGHEFHRAMRAEMQDGMGPEIFADLTIECREGVRRGKTALEQQAHRIALIAETWLQPDEHVAELRAESRIKMRPSRQLAARRRAPFSSIAARCGSRRTWSSTGMRTCTFASVPVRAGISAEQSFAQRIRACRHIHIIAIVPSMP